MPNIAVVHPQVVHFVVAFLSLGVAARVVSLLPLGERFRFTGAMATVLIVLGTLAAVAAVRSGTDAHGPAERVPGAREAVMDHEEWGERTRNVFIGVALLELSGLAFASRRRAAQALRVGSALVGLAGAYVLYQPADYGGDLVYNHAGGVGLRSGDPTDLKRLLVAGLYHNARAAGDSGRTDEAGRLTEELVRQMPDDPTVRFLGVESLIKDHHDPRAALVALAAIEVKADDVRLQIRKGLLVSDAYQALGAADSARATIEALKARYPDNPRVKAMLERMARPSPGAK